ncbi:hypothetical protein [Longimonas halophila]|uniref:hypothetical protein n=1 Tax=Longimonas halophila TaxID=1469170 RepID=UPI001596ABC5|nr:hypothetical protein [Longimonas halophila]
MSDLRRTITRKWLRILRHHLKTFLGTRPALYFPIFRRRSGYDALLVDQDTDICIEGFPRSANSFAAGAFEAAQSHNIRLAHHTHVAANAMRACERGIPAIVLIRDPRDAIVSNIALAHEVRLVETGAVPEQISGFGRQLEAWQAFYDALKPHEDQFVTAPFKQVIEDFGAVIQAVNVRFDTDFDVFNHTKEAADAIHAGRGYHAGPNQRRGEIKERVRTAFEEELKSDKRLRRTLEHARETHAAYLTRASVTGHSSTRQ